jgi:glycosyltransferase involved in cell wall biosynthesis
MQQRNHFSERTDQPTGSENTRLAIIVSHPIQYYTPVFKLLSTKIQLKVFYTAKNYNIIKFDKAFQKKVEWDIPMLEGYESDFIGQKHLIRRINSYNPNCLLVYGWAKLAHLFILAYYHRKIKITFRGDSNLLNKSSALKNVLRKVVLKWIYMKVDYAFYVGTLNKLYFLKYGLKEQQLIFAPHAIENERFARKQINQSKKIRSDLQISEDKIVILYAGKLDVNKNVCLLLEAFIELNLSNLHLIIAGSGLLQNVLRSRAKQIKNVHFIDFQNQTEMPALYQACDLFCLPSKSESWGLSINEAMAAGKAILVSDKVGAAVDLVTRTNGRIFKSDNVEDLKLHLQQMTHDRDFLKLAGTSSEKTIENWTIETQVEKIFRCL